MASPWAYVYGEYVPLEEARISILDTGYFRSDVVYDVVSTWSGFFFRLEDHLRRFLRSAEGFQIRCPYSGEEIARILANCVTRGELENAYVYMAVTRGLFSGHHLRDYEPQFIAYAVPYVWILEPEQQRSGGSVIIATRPRIPSASVDARFKNHHWGDLTQGQLEAEDRDADTAILCDADGRLTEGPGFNVFFAKDGQLYTPHDNILEGITRQTVLDLTKELDVKLEVGDYPADALRHADEAFLTSTAGGIMPITRVDGNPLADGKPGPISSRLRELYWAKREAGWLGTRVDELAER